MLLTGSDAAAFDSAAKASVRSSVAADAGVDESAVEIVVTFPVYMAANLGGVGEWTTEMADAMASFIAKLNHIARERVEVAIGDRSGAAGMGAPARAALQRAQAAGFDAQLSYSATSNTRRRSLSQATLRVPIAVKGAATGAEASALAESLLATTSSGALERELEQSDSFAAAGSWITVGVPPEDEPQVAVDLAVVLRVPDGDAARETSTRLLTAAGSAQVREAVISLGLDASFTALELAMASPSPPPAPPPTPQPPPEPPLPPPRYTPGRGGTSPAPSPPPPGMPATVDTPAGVQTPGDGTPPIDVGSGPADGERAIVLTTPVLAALGISGAAAIAALSLTVVRLATRKRKGQSKVKAIGGSKKASAGAKGIRDLVKRIEQSKRGSSKGSNADGDRQQLRPPAAVAVRPGGFGAPATDEGLAFFVGAQQAAAMPQPPARAKAWAPVANARAALRAAAGRPQLPAYGAEGAGAGAAARPLRAGALRQLRGVGKPAPAPAPPREPRAGDAAPRHGRRAGQQHHPVPPGEGGRGLRRPPALQVKGLRGGNGPSSPDDIEKAKGKRRV